MSAAGAFTGTNYALRATPAIGTLVDGKFTSGNVCVSVDECYATGTNLGAGSTMLVGKLPAGAVPLYTIVYPIDTATYGAPDAMTNAVTGTLGISGDTDLLGDVAALNSATPQVVVPKPDGTTYATGLGFPLKADVDVFFTSASAELVATEGICVKIFYAR